MSEALESPADESSLGVRTTTFVSVVEGMVPLKHWFTFGAEALLRSLKDNRGRSFCKSESEAGTVKGSSTFQPRESSGVPPASPVESAQVDWPAYHHDDLLID